MKLERRKSPSNNIFYFAENDSVRIRTQKNYPGYVSKQCYIVDLYDKKICSYFKFYFETLKEVREFAEKF